MLRAEITTEGRRARARLPEGAKNSTTLALKSDFLATARVRCTQFVRC